MVPLKDGTWVAVLTERRLKKRPRLPLDIPQMLVRSYSTDQGRSWTQPEPLCVGSWASLTPMGDGTVACSFALWSAWGSMEVMFSDDGFRTIRHRSPFVEHNWLPGYGPSGWGKGWARDPIPLPPVAPNLEGDWQAGHYGFSSGLALDDDRLMLVVGQRQKGTGYTDPPHEVNLPIEKERIETIVMKRVRENSAQAAEPPQAHGEPQGQWYLAERWPEEEWRQKVGQPPNDVTLVLKSGRWIRLDSRIHRSPPARTRQNSGAGAGLLGLEVGRRTPLPDAPARLLLRRSGENLDPRPALRNRCPWLPPFTREVWPLKSRMEPWWLPSTAT